MKNLKKIIATVMAIGMTVGCTACNKTSSSKTVVKIVNYEGGYGVKWLYEAKERFEALHNDIYLDIDTNTYMADISVQVSKPLFTWVIGTLGKVRITAPKKVTAEFNKFVDTIKSTY